LTAISGCRPRHSCAPPKVTGAVGPDRTTRPSGEAATPRSSTRRGTQERRASVRTSHAGAFERVMRARRPCFISPPAAHLPAVAGIRNIVRRRIVLPACTSRPVGPTFTHRSRVEIRRVRAWPGDKTATYPAHRTNAPCDPAAGMLSGVTCRMRSDPRTLGSTTVAAEKTRRPGPLIVAIGGVGPPSRVSANPTSAAKTGSVRPSPEASLPPVVSTGIARTPVGTAVRGTSSSPAMARIAATTTTVRTTTTTTDPIARLAPDEGSYQSRWGRAIATKIRADDGALASIIESRSPPTQ
jgi:hypothetical protein